MEAVDNGPLCRLLVAAVMLLATACAGPSDPMTPEEAAARGGELLRRTSDALKAARSLSFSVVEVHERLRRNGQKEPYSLKRDVIVRRPDRMWLHTTGSDNRDVKIVYDGKTVTVVGDHQKVYATVPAPSTLDETLDLVSHRYDLRIAVADFLYSSPHESFNGGDGKGGWVRLTMVGGRECEEAGYAMKAVDFTLAVSRIAPILPCEAVITYKQEPGQPMTRLVFSNWNLKPEPPDAQFVANVPQGYEHVPIVERIPKEELKADAAKAMGK